MSEQENEYCARCHVSDDPDLRTLWMSCFYAMDELKVPFQTHLLMNIDKDAKLEEVKAPGEITLSDGTKLTLTSGHYTTQASMRPMKFFTLRVCKTCRSDWLQAIEDWFKMKPAHKPVSTGVYLRVNGATVEVDYLDYIKYGILREFPNVTMIRQTDALKVFTDTKEIHIDNNDDFSKAQDVIEEVSQYLLSLQGKRT